MYGTDKATAERLAAIANQNVPCPLAAGSERTVTHYEVRGHAYDREGRAIRWGIWPVWAYNDRPDLGAQFGGPFVQLSSIADA